MFFVCLAVGYFVCLLVWGGVGGGGGGSFLCVLPVVLVGVFVCLLFCFALFFALFLFIVVCLFVITFQELDFSKGVFVLHVEDIFFFFFNNKKICKKIFKINDCV